MTRSAFIRNFAGIRPKRIDPETGAVQDFVLECRDEIPGVVNLVGIESPGITSALPLARRAVALIAEREKLVPNPNFNPVRKGIRRFNKLDPETQAKMIAENPDYGEVVCRCEQISRAEIIQAIHNPLGVHTVNGIKVRTRATMGRCQGGYCETRITRMIQEELGKSLAEIKLGNGESWMFTGTVKGGAEE
jgi:glycerol-3-phosphate dehydrogenase